MANTSSHPGYDIAMHDAGGNNSFQHKQNQDPLVSAGFLPHAPPGLIIQNSVPDVLGFRDRFEHLKSADRDKGQLIEDLIRSYNNLHGLYLTTCADLEREKEFNRQYQQEKKKQDESIRNYQSLVQRSPFVVCLIDGDGMLFRDDLLRKGEAGGREAADIFSRAIKERCNLLNIPDEVKIVVRIYANINDLDRIYHLAGILDNRTQVADFSSGFTRSKYLFDFVDVKWGKDRADVKLIENFRLYLDDCHCRHIFFGGSHDNGYARFLEDIDRSYAGKITLLEGSPFAKELKDLPYEKIKLTDMFRNELIVVEKKGLGAHALPASSTTVQSTKPLNANNLTDGKPERSNLENHYEDDVHMSSGAASPALPSRKRSSSGSPSRTLAALAEPTWATTVQKQPYSKRVNTTNIDQTHRQPSSDSILRNRKGQRVDPFIVDWNREDYNRVRDLKLCNYWHIKGYCPIQGYCRHSHDGKLSPYEFKILRLLTRTMPCESGSSCSDPTCMWGHHCAAPLGDPRKTGKNCLHGEKCRFSAEMHFSDQQPVKTTVI